VAEVFVIVNPDIRLRNFAIEPLLLALRADKVGACAPLVLSDSGAIEESARRYPSVASLISRIFFLHRQRDYIFDRNPVDVEWVAGMFVAFRQEAFEQVGGFDERFFLYYEDADICRRLNKNGWRTLLQPVTSVVHNAQRTSRRNLKYFKMHLASMFRFLFLS
jgi:N-acetylglucosaminyl-diphospho-decaprenol L-rhamnosyltransferase